VAGRILGINPFDQPDVESAKKAARSMLEGEPDSTPPTFVDGPVEVRVLGGDWSGGASTLKHAVDALFARLDPERGYVAVMAYLDRLRHADLASVRRTVAARTGRPTTFGWGPRFLHSTGQLHKGGPPTGVFVQVLGEDGVDVPIPGAPYGFSTLEAAQAAGDLLSLQDRGLRAGRVRIDELLEAR
jgi:glucose-6-phosphate isomerase